MASSVPKTMRALLLTKETPQSRVVMSLKSVPTPSCPPGNVLVKVRASAIQPSDLLNAAGDFPTTTFPRIPGRDFSGTVIDGPSSLIGKDVFGTSGQTQAFTVDGYQAEYAVVPEHGVAEKPAHISHVQCATMGVPFSTAALALRRGGAQKGETVLVLGANGAVGNAATILAAQMGCKVLKGVRGPSGDVDTSGDPELKNIMTVTNGRGVDVVFDTVGMPSLTKAALQVLARGGRLTYISAPKKGSTDVTFDMKYMYRNENSMVGCNSVAHSVEEMGDDLKFASQLLSSSQTPLNDSRWETITLEQAVDAYQQQAQHKPSKQVIVME